MEKLTIDVHMLGECILSNGELSISDRNDRSNKTWLLLAYMIYSRERSVPQDEMISLIWGDYDSSADPANALKTILHRTRITLDGLGPGVGKKLISRRQGSYTVSPAVHITTDIDRFESLCKSAAAAQDETKKLENYLSAIDVYKGRFLAKLSNEMWVVRISTYYHNLFTNALQEALRIMENRGMHTQIETVCLRAIKIEPNLEAAYAYLMKSYISLGNQHAAVNTYNSLSNMLYSQFGIMPSDDIRALYREAVRTKNENRLEPHELEAQLAEETITPGALMCEYDFFKVVYRVESRSIARMGIAAHTALLSVENALSGKISKRSLEICMDNLDDIVRSSLRLGDTAARCSTSQYAIILPQANYENGVMIMDRIVKNFNRKFPHSPAKLAYSLQPIKPIG